MYFLNEGEITVSGFDPKINKKRISSFKPDNLILSYVKKEKEDILSVLNEWNPPSKAKIQTAFLNKFRQYETSKNDVWDKLTSKVVTKPLKNAIKEMEKELEGIEIRKGDEIGYELQDGMRHHELEPVLDIYKEWYNEDENAKIWFLNMSLRELDSCLDKTTFQKEEERFNALGFEGEEIIRERSKSIVHGPSVMFGKTQKQSYTPKEMFERGDIINFELLEVNGKWINKNADMALIYGNRLNPTPENFLKLSTPFEKAKEKTPEEVMKMFRIIWFNIICSENYEVMLNSFAWALSDEEDSLEWFELFIESMSDTTSLKNKLFEEINNPEHIDPWMVGLNDKYAMQAAEIRKANENRGKIVRQDESSDLKQLKVLLNRIMSP